MFLVILVLAVAASTSSRSHLLAIFNNISVWWHVIGAAVVVLILVFVPKDSHHWSVTTSSPSGSTTPAALRRRRRTSGLGFWFYVLPLGFLLTQYTITGYDASAHLSEETQGAADGAAKGIWRSIFYSRDRRLDPPAGLPLRGAGRRTRSPPAAAACRSIFDQALSPQLAGTVLLIATHRPALLHHRLPDLGLAHAVRVQP